MKLGPVARPDLIVGGEIVVELKATDQLYAAHEAQLYTYLRHTGKRLGFVLVFGAPWVSGLVHRRVR